MNMTRVSSREKVPRLYKVRAIDSSKMLSARLLLANLNTRSNLSALNAVKTLPNWSADSSASTKLSISDIVTMIKSKILKNSVKYVLNP